MVEHYIVSGALFRVEELPEFIHPAYMVYAQESDNISGAGTAIVARADVIAVSDITMVCRYRKMATYFLCHRSMGLLAVPYQEN